MMRLALSPDAGLRWPGDQVQQCMQAAGRLRMVHTGVGLVIHAAIWLVGSCSGCTATQ
jgi:hypothetical protein